MKIFAAREDDAHQGWVWLQRQAFPARAIIKITNPENRKSVYCEALQIDSNFLNSYNQPPRMHINEPLNTLVIGAWYRAGLGNLETQIELPIEITLCNSWYGSWYGKFMACIGHPQVVVRLASWLGGLGLLLGIIGLALGIIA